MTLIKKQKLNVRLLRRIQKHILREPKRFWMGWWKAESIPGVEPAPCGTTACIAGWALILNREKIPENGVGQRARVLLGIDHYDGSRLFHSHLWPKPFQGRYDRAETRQDPNGMASAAVERIEYFINTGK